jgi:hypothetical protein
LLKKVNQLCFLGHEKIQQSTLVIKPWPTASLQPVLVLLKETVKLPVTHLFCLHYEILRDPSLPQATASAYHNRLCHCTWTLSQGCRCTCGEKLWY